MRVAVIADIHANMYALEAVARRIEQLAPDRLVCAGDLVGYNAQPRAVVQWVREHVDACVAGNHDVDVVTRAAQVGTSSAARRAQSWTRERLDDDERAFLASLPAHVDDASGMRVVHGCYLNTTYYTGYVTVTMLRANLDALAARAGGGVIGICGHTHLPMVAWLRAGAVVTGDVNGKSQWPEHADAVLINPGAVGQPRDGDARASFALVDVDARSAEIHRCDYDVEAAQRAIEHGGLPTELGNRLSQGR